MKKSLLMLAILVLAVSPILAAPVIFLAGADYDIASGVPASPIVIEALPGEMITIAAYVISGDIGVNSFDMILAPVASAYGTWGVGALGSGPWPTGAPHNDGPNVTAPAGTIGFGGMWFFNHPTNLSAQVATFTFTLNENNSESFSLSFLDEGAYAARITSTTGTDYFAAGSVTVNVVPEPATLALLGIGLASLVGIRKKRS